MYLNPEHQSTNVPEAADIIALLGLEPHPKEGGYFRRTYYADERIALDALPGRYDGERRLGSAIYYLITEDSFSALHKLATDEIFHFYIGDPVEMLQLHPDGSGEVILLGTDLVRGMRPQIVVPRGVWQGSRLAPGGTCGYALLGTTLAPGFEYDDYEHGNREQLLAAYPHFHDYIIELTTEDESRG